MTERPTAAQIEAYANSLDEVVGHSSQVIVGIKNGTVHWRWIDGDFPPHLHVLLARYRRRWAAIQEAVSEEELSPQQSFLAGALFSAFCAGQHADRVFDEFAGRADMAITTRLATAYARGAVMTLGVLLTLLLFVTTGALPIVSSALTMGAFPGMLGAFLSVLMRTNSLRPLERLPGWFAEIQGASRVTMGALFGVIAYLGVQGNLIVGDAADNVYLLFVTAVAAGFSERLAPDLLNRIASGVQSGSDPAAVFSSPQQLSPRHLTTGAPTLSDLMNMIPDQPTDGAPPPSSLPAQPDLATLQGQLPDTPQLPDPADLLATIPDTPDA